MRLDLYCIDDLWKIFLFQLAYNLACAYLLKKDYVKAEDMLVIMLVVVCWNSDSVAGLGLVPLQGRA